MFTNVCPNAVLSMTSQSDVSVFIEGLWINDAQDVWLTGVWTSPRRSLYGEKETAAVFESIFTVL